MVRARLILPWMTALLPVIAGTAVLHGALAAAIALLAPLAMDAVLSVRGGVGYTAESSRPTPTGGLYRALFYVYAVGVIVSFPKFVLTSGALPLVDVAGHMASWVVLFGVPTLVVGHALIHGTSKLGRAVGQLLFLLMNYPHFPMLHVETHHRHVATSLDLHSARRNQTFYEFFARCFIGEVVMAIGQRKHRARILALTVVQLTMLMVIVAAAGTRALVVFLMTTFLARVVVGLVNYVQHYGLEREKGQKPSTAHAWDLPHKSASLLYFNAGFHSDHHTKASVDPDQLAFKATRFVIPHNIPIILPMALVPPLFFRTMNPLLGE